MRNLTPQAVKLTIPMGVLERQPRMDHATHAAMRKANRQRYGQPPPAAQPASTLGDIELVITIARRTETLLETHYGALGRGLHEKLTSVETKLPADVLHRGRYVATMRNKVLHIDSFSLPDRDWFLQCAQIIEDHFSKTFPPPPPKQSPPDAHDPTEPAPW